jgi:hypothetical protein
VLKNPFSRATKNPYVSDNQIRVRLMDDYQRLCHCLDILIDCEPGVRMAGVFDEVEDARPLLGILQVQIVALHPGRIYKAVIRYGYRIFSNLQLPSDVELTKLAVKHGLTDVHGYSASR